MCVSDLHFVFQWFWLLSWRRFEGMLGWRYWLSVTLSLIYKYICRSLTYILWYSDSALHFQFYLMNKPHSLDISSDGPLTCISWLSDFESFMDWKVWVNLDLPIDLLILDVINWFIFGHRVVIYYLKDDLSESCFIGQLTLKNQRLFPAAVCDKNIECKEIFSSNCAYWDLVSEGILQTKKISHCINCDWNQVNTPLCCQWFN